MTYPLSIRGAIADRPELRRLTLQALAVGCVVLLPVAVIMCAATAVVGRLDLAISAIVAVSLWQFQETVRRGLLAHLEHRAAVVGDALSYLGQAVLLAAAGVFVPLSPFLAFVAMGATSVLAGLVQAWQLELHPRLAVLRWSEFVDAWHTGRWILGSQLVNGIGLQALPWTLALLRGTAEAAVFQACLNIVSVTNPVIFSIANLMLPESARAASREGPDGAYRAAFRSITTGAILLVPFFAIVAAVPEWVLTVVYGPASAYVSASEVLRVFAVAYVLFCVGGLFVTLLTSLEKTRQVFVCQAASALAGVVVGLPFVAWLGLAGAAVGVFSVHFVRAFVAAILLVRLRSIDALQSGVSQASS